jgi:hypothetical protein
MKSRFFILLAGLVSASIALGYVKSTSQTPQESVRPKSHGRLKQRVQKAKEKGETKLELHGWIFNRAQFINLDHTFKGFHLVEAELVSKKSVVEEDELINTWYKFRIIDTLSKAEITYDFSFMKPPPEMMPLQADEILVPVGGGTMMIDGVEVSSGEPGEPGVRAFDENQKYLFFLCVDPATKVGTVDFGAAGVFIMRDDDIFEPFNNDRRYVYDALKTNSVNEVKEILRHRH